MSESNKEIVDKAVKNDKGKTVIFQPPNFPILAGLGFVLASLFLSGDVRDGVESVGVAFLFVWAYLEITRGESLIRRFIGLVGGALIILYYFLA